MEQLPRPHDRGAAATSMKTHPEVVFELATSSIQFYVFSNYARLRVTSTAGVTLQPQPVHTTGSAVTSDFIGAYCQAI